MDFAVHGDILYSKNLTEVMQHKDSYAVCVNGISQGVFKKLPDKYKGIKIINFKNKLVIPGLVDLHLHAPQYAFIGLHMDEELLNWLNKYTFPEEAKYKNMTYAKRAYDIFINDFRRSATTRFNIFASIHVPATIYLMEKLEKLGMKGNVGKVNMDRNCPDSLKENTNKSIKNTIAWIEKTISFKNVKPIITPRFIPSCTDDLMKGLSDLVSKYNLPVQSHLNENRSEIQWVKSLLPRSKSYENAYDIFGMLGSKTNTVMAHYVWPTESELKNVKEKNVWIAHSPSSNRNLSSGVAPIKKYINLGIKIGLATDIAAGSYMSMFRSMEDAITSSKIHSALIDSKHKPLTMKEAFFLATKGGGSFFGNVGSFEKGYEFDAIVLDESNMQTVLMPKLSLFERFERYVYNPTNEIISKIVAGKKVL